jgi:hypothetical protein
MTSLPLLIKDSNAFILTLYTSFPSHPSFLATKPGDNIAINGQLIHTVPPSTCDALSVEKAVFEDALRRSDRFVYAV